ncbi:MAG TPA: hypothetical protein VGW36_07950 [Pyrinomonadaceae bacterium]|nr:hypothetical protein [Pyrinomonadaceae bacterium]
MNKFLFRVFAAATLSCAASFCAHAQKLPEPPLTNTAIIKLVRAGFKDKTVIAIINNRPNKFALDPDRLIELKRNGVSENIILAMLAQDESFVFQDDGWPNDDFRVKRTPAESDPRNESGGDIFGSSSGSRSSTDGRGLSGGNQDETTTTGSATVRIIRPPAEANGPPKLERTPTLTNDSVIQLVNAGFSEGTIIKRIENSPVDFDLSRPRLDELRRRRVTEPIIAAMNAAMSDGSDNKQGTPAKAKGK